MELRGMPSISSIFREDTAPVRSLFRTVPYPIATNSSRFRTSGISDTLLMDRPDMFTPWGVNHSNSHKRIDFREEKIGRAACTVGVCHACTITEDAFYSQKKEK